MKTAKKDEKTEACKHIRRSDYLNVRDATISRTLRDLKMYNDMGWTLAQVIFETAYCQALDDASNLAEVCSKRNSEMADNLAGRDYNKLSDKAILCAQEAQKIAVLIRNMKG